MYQFLSCADCRQTIKTKSTATKCTKKLNRETETEQTRYRIKKGEREEKERENVERTENCRTDTKHIGGDGGNGTAKNCRATDRQDRKNGQTGGQTDGQTDGQTIRDVVVSLGRSFIRSFVWLDAFAVVVAENPALGLNKVRLQQQAEKKVQQES